MNTVRKYTTALAVLAGAWPLLAQTSAPASTPPTKEEEVLVLSPFEVNSAEDTGYAATQTLAGTRIRTDLKDVGSAISVITKEFMQDIGATGNDTLLQYTTNAEVAGTRGTYAGLGNGTTVDETAQLRAPGGAQRVRGLAAADNTRDFFVTDIPWDSYNVDRIDIQRGPNSILFGLGSPAGIINASLNTASFRNGGNVQYRVGSYGSQRGSLDANQVLIKDVLSIRIDGLWNAQKYQQDQAFQNDKRFFGSVRFDPQLFKDPDFHTSFKAKYEHGDIQADRPRITPPADSITPWFRPVNLDPNNLTGGVGKTSINNAYEVGSNASVTVNPWVSAGIANQQQPIWLQDGTTNQLYRITGGYINNGFVNNDGSFRGAGNSAIGQRYSDQLFGLTSLSSYATNAKLAGYQYGQYRQQALQDPTVFDFYHNLIDGPTKKEWEKWDAYNLDFSQTGWGDRVGLQLSYDRQEYNRGGQALLGNPTLTIDILKNYQDLTANPNYGRAYVAAGPGGGNSYESDRKYFRASVFGEVRTRDFIKSDFWSKLLGKHRFNGVYSDEDYATENRSWQMYANSREWAAYWNATDGSTSSFKDRPPVTAIYLGSSLASAASAAGAYIPGITAPIVLNNGGVYSFNSTFKGNVTPSAPWTVPANLLPIYDPATATTQASNPANYTGWNTNFQDNLLRYDDGRNDAIIPTFGWRYDEVKGKGVTAAPVTSNRSMLNLQPDVYKLPATFPESQIFKDHSTSGGIVVHINKLFTKDPLPINVSFSYNKSDNFQVTDVRRDVFGKPLANPTGATKDYGVLLSTKDGKYSFRAIKYETSIANGSTQLDLGGLAGTITQGIKFRNVFLYQMSGYTWDTREDGYVAATNSINVTPGNRHFWTPAYVNSAGRPVADLTGAGGSTAGATLETQAQADAHRDASITAWNQIQKTLDAAGFFAAWNYSPTTISALTTRAAYEATLGPNTQTEGARTVPVQNNAALVPAISSLASYTATAPSGITVTSDSQSKGYEFELTANPLPNWRLTFNASETEAIRTNVGGATLDNLVSMMDTAMAGVAGDMRQFNGNYVAGNEVRQNWANWRGQYTLLKLQEGAAASELRKWRYNFITNYTFTHGAMKNVGVGGAYRWQDKVVIGYPVIPGTNGQASFDLSKPYYGPSESGVDLWVSYERKLSAKLNWKIQLNVSNVGQHNGLIPTSVEPDGVTWAAARVTPVQEWYLTNTIAF
jgi:hypothetical protein